MLLRHERLRLRELDAAVRGRMPYRHALFEHAGAHAHERQPVTVRGIHVCLNLEDESGEFLVRRINRADIRNARRGRFGVGQKPFEERLYAEIVGRGAEEHRRELSGKHLFDIEFVARNVEQLDILDQLVVIALSDHRRALRIVQTDLANLDLRLSVIAAAVQLDHARVAVINALEVSVNADRPVHRARADAEHLLDFLHQFKRIPARAVHLVHECENRNRAQTANLEQLDRLFLNALGIIDQHHRAVRGDERSIRILGEVLMTGRIQNVDPIAVIIKLHRRGRDRDAALLFDFHPVRSCVARGFARLDGARLPNRAAVKQELFRQRRFAGVRVRNNCEGAPARHFRLKLGMKHNLPPECQNGDSRPFPAQCGLSIFSSLRA